MTEVSAPKPPVLRGKVRTVWNGFAEKLGKHNTELSGIVRAAELRAGLLAIAIGRDSRLAAESLLGLGRTAEECQALILSALGVDPWTGEQYVWSTVERYQKGSVIADDIPEPIRDRFPLASCEALRGVDKEARADVAEKLTAGLPAGAGVGVRKARAARDAWKVENGKVRQPKSHQTQVGAIVDKYADDPAYLSLVKRGRALLETPAGATFLADVAKLAMRVQLNGRKPTSVYCNAVEQMFGFREPEKVEPEKPSTVKKPSTAKKPTAKKPTAKVAAK